MWQIWFLNKIYIVDYDELKQKLEIYKDKLVQAETIKQSSEAEEKDLHKLLQVSSEVLTQQIKVTNL